MKPSLSIIVPTHDRPEELARLVEALCHQQYPPSEVILVNDGEQEIDAVLLKLLQTVGITTISIRRETPGLPASRNAGLQKATGEVICFFDDDMVPPPDLLEYLATLYEQDIDGAVDGIGLPFKNPPARWTQRLWSFLAVGQNHWTPRHICSRFVTLPQSLSYELTPAARFSGGAMSFRAELAREIQFDESFVGYALGEDRELCYRIARKAALFMTTRRTIPHQPGLGGRGEMDRRGEEYVQAAVSTLEKNVGWDAGSGLMLSIDFISLFSQHFVWGVLAPGKGHWAFVRGMLKAFKKMMADWTRRTFCES